MKELTKHQEFKPTPAMILYAAQRAKLGENTTDSDISKKIGIRAETISRWKQINGFDNWLADELLKYRAPIKEMLEAIAISRINDFKYWEVLARKYCFYTDNNWFRSKDDSSFIDTNPNIHSLSKKEE